MSTVPIIPDDENLPPALRRRSVFTKPDTALLDPQTGEPTFVGSPSQVLAKANAGLPSAEALLGPDVLNPEYNTELIKKIPFIGQPSLSQAAEVANPRTGIPVSPLQNPSLSKLGKLLGLLGGAVQGALAGQAASEQAIMESGGRRSGGVGTGFTAGYQLPFLRQFQRQQVERGQLENQMSQAQLQQMSMPIQLPDGRSIPIWQAMQMGKWQEVEASIAQKRAEAQKNQFVTPRGGGVYDVTRQAFAPGAGPTPAKPDSPEQQFIDEYQRKNPGSSIAEAEAKYRENDPAFIESQASHEQAAADRQQAAADRQEARQETARQRQDAATERSYQFHAGRLDKLRQPVEQQLDRLSRLSDTLDQGTPQADALVAPELLTAMAGGQGSGLRMNEAEIARIVGGRNNWESIKARVRAWQTDPNKGFSLTPSQRQQVRALLEARTSRLRQQQAILDRAGDDLVGATSAQEHRAIYNRTQQALSRAMSGSAITVTDPRGVVHTFPSQSAADAFKKAAGIQ